MEEAENSSFLDMKDHKYFRGMLMATGPPKPYVSCIKINGVPILPPLLDEASRREMRVLREKAVAVERRLSLSRQRRDNSGDSGVGSTLVLEGRSLSTSVNEHYLTAVDHTEDSVCSVYQTPGNRVSAISPRKSLAVNSIEQRLSFDVVTPRVDLSERTEPCLSTDGDLGPSVEGSEKSPDSTTLTASTDLNPYLDVTEDIESPTPETRRQDIGGASALEGDVDASPGDVGAFGNNLVQCNGALVSGSHGPSRSTASRVESENFSPRSNEEKTDVPRERSRDLESQQPSLDPTPRSFGEPGGHVASGSVFTSTPHGKRVASLHDLSPSGGQGGDRLPPPASRSSSAHAFGLVPPDVCLRPAATIADWLLSSSRATPSTVSSREHTPEGSRTNLARVVSSGENTEVFSKNYNNPDSGLDLEPSKLVVEVESSVQSTVVVVVPQQCLANSVTEPGVKADESSVATESQDVEKQEEQWFLGDATTSLKSILLTDKSDQSANRLPAALGDDAIPPLIRQHSFTVQTGPSNLLRCYVEENGMELNTGTFQNPKPTEPFVKCDAMSTEVVNKTLRDGAGRKGWDLNEAKAMWVSGNKLQPFAKPKPPVSRLKKQVLAKHRTRSVPSVYSASSLPNSPLNSPEKSQEGYGSVDGLNYKIQTPQKRPRRSLHFSGSSPKSATKFADHLHTNRLGLSSQVQRRALPLSSPSNKQPGLKTCQSNTLPVDWNKIGNPPCSSNSLKNVALSVATKPNEATLPLQTIECPKENTNLTKQLLHLKTEHNKQMALLLEKQRAEQERIQEMFMIQQHKLMEEMQRSYPDAFNSAASVLATETTQQTEEPRSAKRELSREESPVRAHETAKLLQENVCRPTRNESSRNARWHNTSMSKENLTSFLSVESLYESDSNKENVEQFKREKQIDFEGLTIESIPLNQSLPHLIISDSDLEILPYCNDFETSNIGHHLPRTPDSSCHISKPVSTLSEEICNLDLDLRLSPRMHRSTINGSTVCHNDSTYQRNLQNSIGSNRSMENLKVHRSYETLVVRSFRENDSSRSKSGPLELSHSSLGRVRHSPRSSARRDEDNEGSSVYVNGVERTYDTFHPSICAPALLDFRPIQGPSKQEKLAAAKIVAAARGYLVRRLMRTELVQNMITTIAETLKTAIELREEILNVGNIHMTQADLDLRERLHNQLESEHQSLYALFVHSSEAHRVAVIAADRERIKTQLSRSSSGQRPLSSATQRCLKRKQEPEQQGPTPLSRPSSSRTSSRRPLWETASGTGRQRSCSGHPVPTWVVNPKPATQLARPPPSRKPWR